VQQQLNANQLNANQVHSLQRKARLKAGEIA